MIEHIKNPRPERTYTQDIEHIHGDITDCNSPLAAKRKLNPQTREPTSF